MSIRTWWRHLLETEDERLARLYPEAGGKAADARDFDRLHRDYIRNLFAAVERERAADAAEIRRDAVRLKAEQTTRMRELIGPGRAPRRRRWLPWW